MSDPLILAMVPVSMQPVQPRTTWLNNHPYPGGNIAAISRHWPDGWTFEACQLCPLAFCSLAGTGCLISANTVVTSEQAPRFSLREFLGAGA